MQMAQYVPDKAFKLWHQIPRFFVTKGAPLIATSSGLLLQMSLKGGEPTEDHSSLDANGRSVEHDGTSRADRAEISRHASRFLFNENTVGANSEALQCLRKEGSDWGVCSDYAQYAQMLAAREQSMDDRISIHAYFAATDALVGSRGQKYFEQCWQAPGVEAIEFVSTNIAGTNHDSLMESADVWNAIFAVVGGRPIADVLDNK
jgi:hypothetical protein